MQGAVHGAAVCEAIVELLCDEPICNWLRMAGAVVLLCVVGLHLISAPHPHRFWMSEECAARCLTGRFGCYYYAFPIIRSKQIQNRPEFPIKIDLF